MIDKIHTTGDDGKAIQLTIKPPGHKTLQEAQMVYNLELTSLIKKGVADGSQLLSRQQLDKYLSELGIWTEEDSKCFMKLQLEIRSLEFGLLQGGGSISDGKKVALKIKIKRAELLSLYHRRSQFDAITMESIAENHKFKFLVTKCVTSEIDNQPYFASTDDYDSRQNEQATVDISSAFAGYLYGYDKDTEANLAENQWLQKFGFADDGGRLINEAKRLVDIHGRLVDESGRFVNDDGKFVDDQGRIVDVRGNFVVEDAKPFLPDGSVKPKTRSAKKTKK